MKKTIAIVLAMLMALPFAFAGYTQGVRVGVYDETDATPFKKIFTDNSPEYDRIVVCTPKDKNPKNTYAIMPNKSYLQQAIDLFNSMKGAGGYDHFGCNTITLAATR